MSNPCSMSSGGNPETQKGEFQILENKQQVVWALFKMWVTLEMTVSLKSHLHSRFQCMLLSIRWGFNTATTMVTSSICRAEQKKLGKIPLSKHMSPTYSSSWNQKFGNLWFILDLFLKYQFQNIWMTWKSLKSICSAPTWKLFVTRLCCLWKLLEMIRDKIRQEGEVQREGKRRRVVQSWKRLKWRLW